MENRKLENKIRSAYESIAPDILDTVLSDCEKQKGQVIVMQEKKKKNAWAKYVAGIAAAFVLIFGSIIGINTYNGNHAVASTIMLDVNPSLEIQVNKNEEVLNVIALNEDAKIVVGDMDFSGSSLDVTVNALIGSMLRNGYISEGANSILVTVDSNDAVVGQELQAKLMSEINAILESGNISGAVLGQTVAEDKDTRQLAQQYGITVGKAKLIEQIAREDPIYTFEDLVPLTINELNLISESGGTKLENITSIGTASDSAYIGDEAAKEVAFRHAGIAAAEAVNVKCEMDWEKGIMVYEVEFDAAGFEYEYEINAKTGEIVKSDKEADDDHAQEHTNPKPEQKPDDVPPSSEEAYIGDAAGKAAAFKHAGVNAGEVFDCACELEYENGLVVYEIDFKANGYEYDYDINALTGEVVKHCKDVDDDHHHSQATTAEPTRVEQEPSPTAPSESEASYIGLSAAKAAAISHAGVNADHVRDCDCEFDWENGVAIYEVSFDCDGFEYDYEIDAVSGTVLRSEKESG